MNSLNLLLFLINSTAIVLIFGCEHVNSDEYRGEYGQYRENGETCDRSTECSSNHCDNGICCEETESICCLDHAECLASHPFCSLDYTCEGCGSDRDCQAEYPNTPYCDPETRTCVECLSDLDCRSGTRPPQNSPLGICTPDNTCTCWVKPAEENRWSCERQKDCPVGLVCAQERNKMMHHACLRPCDIEGEVKSGFGCDYRNTVDGEKRLLLWGPMTSCYAYEMFGKDCSADRFACRAVANHTPFYEDGYCQSGPERDRCTYYCNNLENLYTDMDSWCPQGFTCHDSLCQPEKKCSAAGGITQ